MIERDGVQVALNTGHLDESGIRSKLEAIGYTGNGLPLGLLRQADLDMKQLEYIKNLMQEYIEAFDDDADELILAWAEEAIAAKEWEADKSQTQPSWAYTARETVIGGVNINFDAVKVNGTTNAVTEVRPITASGELAYTIAVSPAFDLSKGTVRAYKVGDDGSLINKTLLAMRNGDDWMLTIESDSNSTYIITYEPAKASEEHTHSFEWVVDKEATATETGLKHEECSCGEKRNENTVIPKQDTDIPVTPTEPIAPVDPTTPTEPATPVGPSTPTESDNDVKSPQTGDNSNIWLWVALLFISGAGLAGTTIYGRKRRTN